MDKQSFSLQQDHALSVQKYYTHNWAFGFLLLEEREDGISTELEYHSSCITAKYLRLESWSSLFSCSFDQITSSSLSCCLPASWDSEDSEVRRRTVAVHVPVSLLVSGTP